MLQRPFQRSSVYTISRHVQGLYTNIAVPNVPLTRSFHATSKALEAQRDYYEVLGVSREADKNEMKKQYYKLAKKYHPDANKDDPKAAQKFAEANDAWEVLGDEEKRNKYDTFGHAGVDGNGFDPSGASGFGGFEDVFSSFFGGQQQQQGRRGGATRGSDLQMNVRLSFMEAVKGTTRDLHVVTNVECKPCKGSGAKPGTSASTCGQCNGSGAEVHQQGFFAVERPCRRCHGAGTTIKSPCKSCGGKGNVKKPREVEVKIPEGVDTGMNLRLSNQGEAGTRGGPAGHLYVNIEVMSDPFFKRDGTDILIDVPISISQAILGGTVVIPTLTGEVDLKVRQMISIFLYNVTSSF